MNRLHTCLLPLALLFGCSIDDNSTDDDDSVGESGGEDESEGDDEGESEESTEGEQDRCEQTVDCVLETCREDAIAAGQCYDDIECEMNDPMGLIPRYVDCVAICFECPGGEPDGCDPEYTAAFVQSAYAGIFCAENVADSSCADVIASCQEEL